MKMLVLSGGPAGGKTTILRYVQEKAKMDGIHVLVCPEAAQMLIDGGITPLNVGRNCFEDLLYTTQTAHEKAFATAAGQDGIVLLDRCVLDQLAYINEDAFRMLLGRHGTTMEDVLERYDACIHLRTIAGTEAFPMGTSIRRMTAVENEWSGDPQKTQKGAKRTTRWISAEEAAEKEFSSYRINKKYFGNALKIVSPAITNEDIEAKKELIYEYIRDIADEEAGAYL